MSDNPFLLSNAQKEQTPSKNPFALSNIEAEQNDQLRTRLYNGAKADPAKAARADILAKESGLPSDVVMRNLQDVEFRRAVEQADATLKTSPKLAQALREQMFLAEQAHKDVPSLSQLEQQLAKRADRTVVGTFGDIGVTALKGAVGLPQAFVGLADIVTGGYAGAGLEAVGLRFGDAQKFLDQMYSPAQQRANEAVREAQGFLDTLGAMLANPSTIATTVGESAPQMLGGAAIGRGILAMAPKVAPWLAAAFGEGVMGAGATAEQVRSENADGLLSAKQVFASVMSGAGTALFGAAGGRAAQKLGLGDIDTVLVSRGVDEVSAKTLQRGFVARLASAGVSEGFFEEMPQSVQEQMWNNFATDKPLGEGVGKAAAQGLLVGLSMGTGFQAVSEAGTALQRRQLEREAAVTRALNDSQQLTEAMQSAAQVTLRENNPTTFQQLIDTMAKGADGEPQSVFIDAQVLMQLATPEQINELLPSVAGQLREAATTNSSVEVPVAEALTRLPGTPLEQVFLQNAKSSPDALSQLEAEEAGKKAQEFLKQEEQRILKQVEDAQVWQASSDKVKQTILDQLNATGRFTPSVNDAYATLQQQFFSVMAQRLGTTPEDLYKRYALKVRAQGQPGAQVLNANGQQMGQGVIGKFPVLTRSLSEYQSDPGALVSEIENLLGDTTDVAIGIRGPYRDEMGKNPRNSWQSPDGVKRSRLPGVSTVGVSADWSMDPENHLAQTLTAAFKRLKDSGYGDTEYVSVIAGEFHRANRDGVANDPGEMIISKPRVVGYIRRKANDTLNQPFNGPRLGEVNVIGYHYSMEPRAFLNSAMFGTGLKGSNRELYANAQDQRLRKRISFYVNTGNGITPEAGVGGVAHRANLSNIYDANSDPLRLRGGDQLAFESRVLDAGFDGYLDRLSEGGTGQVIMLGDRIIQPELIGPSGRITDAPVVPAPAARPSAGRDLVVDKLMAEKGNLPAGSPTLGRWSQLLQGMFPEEYAALAEAGVFSGNLDENLFFDEVLRRFTDLTEAPVYEQRARAVPAQVAETADVNNARQVAASRKWATNRDFKLALQEAVLAAAGNRDLRADTPENRAYLIGQLVKEAREALITNANAVGWYDEKVTTALEVVSTIHPELKTDEQAKFAFIWALAVTSNGVKVDKNFELAERSYRHWKENGVLPTTGIGVGPTASKIHEGLRTYNTLLQRWGFEALKSFATTLQSNREVKAQFGRGVNGEGVDTQVYGAGVLGPKIGNGFFMNLYGEFGQLTMDRWWVRMWGRLTGDLIEIDRAKIRASRDAFVGLIDLIKQDKEATRAVQAAIGTRLGKGDPAEMAKAIIKATAKEEVRTALAQVLPATAERKAAVVALRGRTKDFVSLGDELRKAAKSYYGNLDGQIEVPGGSRRRDMMREVSQAVLAELQKAHPHLTMADFQALMWYPEKTLYDSAGAQEQDAEGYQDDEAPDYANAAVALARTQGISDEQINAAIERARSDIAARQRAGRGGRGPGGVPAQGGDGAGANPAGAQADTGAGGLNEGYQQAGDRGGRYSGGGLAPLEGAPNVLGAAGPDPRLVAVAEQYARENGIELKRQAEYVQVDEARAARIAQAYAEMQHAPNDPKVKAAYEDLIRQTRAQYDALVAAGYEFTFFDDTTDTTDPYQGNPWNAMRDLRANQRMAVYGTYAGFGVGADLNIGLADPKGGENLDPQAVLAAIKDIGGDIVGSVIHTSATEPTLVVKLKTRLDGTTATQLSEALGQEAIAQSFEDGTGQLYGPAAANWGEYNPEFFVTADGRRAAETLNPLLADTGLQWPDQNGVMRPVKANDLFRAVHDAFGHGLEGAGFRAQGEENAWQAHVRLFTGAAVGAITSETRGQNSWLNYGPYGENNRNAKVENTVFAEQKTGLMPEWTWSEGRAADMQSEVLEQGARGTFNPKALAITLNENADLSTFLHESGHFFLDVMADMASQANAPAEVKADMAALLKWFGVPDLATWNSYTLDQKRPHHEKFAQGFEAYLFEGKTSNPELQSVFRRFSEWLKRVYQSLTKFVGDNNIKLSEDVRMVMDRMLATEEQIRQAEEAAGLLPNFDATNEAIEQQTARSLRDMAYIARARGNIVKELQKHAADLRAAVEAEVRKEVEQQPLYAVMRWLRRGEMTQPDGTEIKAEKGFRLSTAALAEMYPESMLGRPALENLKGMTAKDGLHPDLMADMFGFQSGDQLVRAILDAEPIASVVEGMTDQRMLERYGELATQEAIEAAANDAIHNKARARILATEMKAQAEMLNGRTDTGRTASNGRAITVNSLMKAAKDFASALAGRRRIEDLKKATHLHRTAEARAGKAWQEATGKGDTQAAVQAKRDQVLNNAAVRALLDAQAEAKKIVEFFRKVTKGNNEKIVKGGRDPDVVNAMRAVLATYGVAPRLEKSAQEYMEVVSKNDPAMYNALKPGVDAAVFNAKPLNMLTMDELRALNDELQAMWALAKRSRQSEIDGNLIDRQELEEGLVSRMQDIGVPDALGATGAPTKAELARQKLQHVGSLLRRVEQWAEGMDGAWGGPFLRYVFQPVKEAANRYRAARVDYRKRYQALVDKVAPFLTKGTIVAPELGNYEFGRDHRSIGHAELLHAILHTGNDSNKRKLLLGRGWATENPDGSLDTSRWDSFVARMIAEGKLRKEHYDFVQGVWDLLEETKPLAQKTHREVYGRYFDEVTANQVVTPFGTYRGGYVPAQVDTRIVSDNEDRKLAEAENENMAYSFPTANKGFTKSRTEYNKPLLLDLRSIGQHIDKVLLFSYMQSPINDVNRLLSSKGVSAPLSRIDPTIYAGMLTPWLSRSVRQIVETPVIGDGGISRVLTAARSRAGMSLMFANVSNAIQQTTGFLTAMSKLKSDGLQSHMMRATAQFIANPKKTAQAVADASEFMARRMENEIAALNDAMDAILLDPSLYEKAQAWTQKHAYFLQTALANTMEPIIWNAAYNAALEKGMSDTDAVRYADGLIRQTQGSTLPEDVSRIETGPAYARVFTQFIGYFNMMANTLATGLKQIAEEMGLKKGAGKALGIVTLGMLAPLWVAEAIALAMKGGPEDEDDDGYLDDWLAAVLGMGTIKGMFAMVPFVGQLANAGINRLNNNPADDRVSLSPAVSLLEFAVGVPSHVYKAMTGDADKINARNAVRDVASAVSIATGLPAVAVARPLGYLAGMADDRIEPTGPVDFLRGMISGTASPESKQR